MSFNDKIENLLNMTKIKIQNQKRNLCYHEQDITIATIKSTLNEAEMEMAELLIKKMIMINGETQSVVCPRRKINTSFLQSISDASPY